IAAKVTFWEALDDLRKKGKLEFAAEQVPGEIQFVAASGDQPAGFEAVTYFGPFRIAAAGVQQRKVFGSTEKQLLRFRVHLMAEPRLRPLFLQYSLSTLTAAATGKPNVVLRPLSPDAKYELALAGEGQISIQFDFHLPTKPKTETPRQ